MADAERGLTATQELVLDVLAARYRTGDRLWTFTTRVRPALRALESAGLVELMGGVTEGTVRASLTVAGRERWLSNAWVPPLDTPERSDVVRLLRARCEQLVATVRAMSAVQMDLAEANDAYREVLAAIHREADSAPGGVVSTAILLNLIRPTKESL